MKNINKELTIEALALGYLATHPGRGEVYRYRKNWGHFSKAIKVTGNICNGGYRQMTLKMREKRLCILLHNIIWLAKHGNIKAGHIINHKNHDKTDNRISNLEEITQSENMKKAYKFKPHWRTNYGHTRRESKS